MVKIITDTSALFTVENGIHMGVDVLPLCVSIDDHQYRDLCFDTKLFLDKIKEGHVPSSSQPPIGEVLAAYEDAKEEEILNITMADGLSGKAAGMQCFLNYGVKFTNIMWTSSLFSGEGSASS